MTRESASPRGRTTLDRLYDADLADVWDLWTIREGFESWWGPGGFTVTVHELDLRPGGTLSYAMTAAEPAMVEYMRASGMPTTTEARLTWTEIVPRERLAYVHLADFIPGVPPYSVATVVEFRETPQGVRMTLTFDAMHDDEWTTRARMGWESQLTKLEARLSERDVS